MELIFRMALVLIKCGEGYDYLFSLLPNEIPVKELKHGHVLCIIVCVG